MARHVSDWTAVTCCTLHATEPLWPENLLASEASKGMVTSLRDLGDELAIRTVWLRRHKGSFHGIQRVHERCQCLPNMRELPRQDANGRSGWFLNAILFRQPP
jgi:hypothetical protein